MQSMQALLFLVALATGEVVNSPPVGFSMERRRNHSSSTASAATTTTQEGTKIESWSPSQPELTQMLSYPSMPNPQPFVPANYYLPGDHFTTPPNEYRSEHYNYPFDSAYAYPVPQPPPIDSSLIPTTKHFVIVSFIGLLLLFAIIQNSIISAKRKDALVEVLSNRRKRSIMVSTDFSPMTPEVETTLNEDARVRCIQRTLCYENRKLHEDFGYIGNILGKYLTQRKKKIKAREKNCFRNLLLLRRHMQGYLKEFSPSWDRLVMDAANAGMRGEDCNVIYRDCNFDNPYELVGNDAEESEIVLKTKFRMPPQI
ncbi:PREDICTED: uncharacterized protein LOC105359028 [Ceratosolen solmsi marchali]|uniref:Uncharacterized protein LOC105359028 n=1 Tax=Ceratosolen solmsi marchali TaxID=326594 RepID=A0AAJ6VIF4_9HYME|nr:PREDICTED: uncharacterized protein LOC105359028 [Ceratosolen solmsi marchali]